MGPEARDAMAKDMDERQGAASSPDGGARAQGRQALVSERAGVSETEKSRKHQIRLAGAAVFVGVASALVLSVLAWRIHPNLPDGPFQLDLAKLLLQLGVIGIGTALIGLLLTL